MSLKLVSINIERDKHLDRVIPFIEREQPDVLCLQEVCEKDLPLFKQTMSAVSHTFAPMVRNTKDAGQPIVGVAILSRIPVWSFAEEYYVGSRDRIPDIDHDRLPTDTESPANCVLLVVEIKRHTERFRIGTTHFSWSPRGEASNRQRQDIRALLDNVRPLGELVLCGDLNVPRGGEIFSFIDEYYTDWIPKKYKTSIDVNLHRLGKERPQELSDKMVDGLFATSGYRLSGVRLQFGISDHAAIVATVHITNWRHIFDWWDILRW